MQKYNSTHTTLSAWIVYHEHKCRLWLLLQLNTFHVAYIMQGSEDGLTLVQASVVQQVDTANHWMNHSPMGNSIGFGSIYAMDPTFQQLGPDVLEHYLWSHTLTLAPQRLKKHDGSRIYWCFQPLAVSYLRTEKSLWKVCFSSTGTKQHQKIK